MSPRRLALVLAIAVAAAASTVGATAARASSTICVALVVDAHTIGGGVSTSCATVPKGATGVDVLQAAGHRVGFRSDGLICTLDGVPRGGCGAVDASHYWAYFHRAPGTTAWIYSTEGASTYEPSNTATEGWVWDDGESLTPKNVPYEQICRTKPTPTATPTPGHPSPRKPSPASQPRHKQEATTASAPPTSAPTPSTSTHHRHHGDPRGGKRRVVAATTSRPVTSPSPSPVAVVDNAAGDSTSHGMLNLLIGLVVVAALGGLAALRFRRSKR